jgi:hypothetical protein
MAQAVDYADPGESLPDMGPDFDFDDVLPGDFGSEVEKIGQEIQEIGKQQQQQIGQDIWNAIMDAIEHYGAPTMSPGEPVMKRALAHPRLLGWAHYGGYVVAKFGYHMPLRCERIFNVYPMYIAYKKNEFYYGKTRWNSCIAKAVIYWPYGDTTVQD